MSRMGIAIFYAALAACVAAMGIFVWQMAELFIATDAMFDALEAALGAQQ